MDSDVQSQKLYESLIIAKAKKRGEIVGIVLPGINGRKLASAEYIAVDTSGNVRKFRNSAKINFCFSYRMLEYPQVH